jgi:hypothetical protein
MVDESDQSQSLKKEVGNHAAMKSVICCMAYNCKGIDMKEPEVLKRVSWS